MAHPKLTICHFADQGESPGYQIGSQTIAVQITTQHGHGLIKFFRRKRFEISGCPGDLTQKAPIKAVTAKMWKKGAAHGAGGELISGAGFPR